MTGFMNDVGVMQPAQGWTRRCTPQRAPGIKNPARNSGRAAFFSFNFSNNLIWGVRQATAARCGGAGLAAPYTLTGGTIGAEPAARISNPQMP
jgi:hypothetical protein